MILYGIFEKRRSYGSTVALKIKVFEKEARGGEPLDRQNMQRTSVSFAGAAFAKTWFRCGSRCFAPPRLPGPVLKKVLRLSNGSSHGTDKKFWKEEREGENLFQEVSPSLLRPINKETPHVGHENALA
jgi:hypothetical protein